MAISLIYTGLDRSYRDTIVVPAESEISLETFLMNYLPHIVESLINGPHISSGFAILIDGRNATQIGELAALVRDGATVLITTHSVGG